MLCWEVGFNFSLLRENCRAQPVVTLSQWRHACADDGSVPLHEFAVLLDAVAERVGRNQGLHGNPMHVHCASCLPMACLPPAAICWFLQGMEVDVKKDMWPILLGALQPDMPAAEKQRLAAQYQQQYLELINICRVRAVRNEGMALHAGSSACMDSSAVIAIFRPRL